MTFLLSKFAGVLLRPSTLMLLCCVGGLALRRRWLLRAGVLGFVLVLLLPMDQLALLPLEDRFPRPPELPADISGIIVLGGAVDPDLTADRGIPSLNGAAERMTDAVALLRRSDRAKLVFAGSHGTLLPGSVTEAESARRLFSALGVPPDRLVLEGESRTTWENALKTKTLVQPKPDEVWLLVTSASHLPRAVGAFRAAGWPVLGWPVGYKSGHDWRLWLPSSLGQHLSLLDGAIHEWVGLVAYRALGRSDALFPAP